MTKQELFWQGKFGDKYISRNNSGQMVANNLFLFSNILKNTTGIKSIIEFGANIGLNLIAIKALLPDVEISGVEINKEACSELSQINDIKVYNSSIAGFIAVYKRDFVLTKCFLIHINPQLLPAVYETIYKTSKKYICIAEYYNPTPATVVYRGHKNKLFKRDFAGELLRKFKDLRLINYGFSYHKDNNFKQDDLTWFLLEK